MFSLVPTMITSAGTPRPKAEPALRQVTFVPISQRTASQAKFVGSVHSEGLSVNRNAELRASTVTSRIPARVVVVP